MPDQGDLLQVVHAGALQRPVGKVEAGRLDDVDFHPQAGAQSEDRAGVLRDVGLVENKGNHGRAKPAGWRRVKPHAFVRSFQAGRPMTDLGASTHR